MSSAIPVGWEYDFLSKFIIINPKLDKALELSDDKNVSFIKMEDVSNSAVVTNLRVKKYSEVKKGFTKFQDNDVLVAKITPCFENGKGGHVKKLVNGVGFGSTEFHVFRAKEDFDSAYFHQFANFPSFRLQAEASMCGTGGQRRVQTDFFRTYKTSFPPLPEQIKIAQILTSVDEVIEKTQAQIDKLKDLKTGMMQELLTKGIGHLEFKDSPVGRIPIGWEVVELENLVNTEKNITYGIVQAGPHYDGGIPYIRVSDMSSRHLSSKGMLLTSPAIAEKFKRSAVSTGDIVYALRGMIGHVHIVPYELDGANLTQGTARISPCHTINSQYLLWAMKSPYVAVQNDLEAKGSTFREITLASLRKIKVCVPKIDEQQKIVSVFEGIDERIFAVEDKLSRVKSIKKALMQDLLTGKVRVKLNE